MYDPILAKSFSRYDRKRFGFLALILCFVIALSICSSFKPRLHHLSFMIGDAVNLQLMSINAVEDEQLLMDGMSGNSEATGKNDSVIDNAALLDKPMDAMLQADDTNPILKPIAIETKKMKPLPEPIAINHAPILQKQIDASPNTLQANDTNAIIQPIVSDTKKTKPLCRILDSNADYCEIEGDVRVDANSSTVFLVRPRLDNISLDVKNWIIQPYPRKGIAFVKNWTVTLTTQDDESIPKCTKIHNLTAILFSISGYSGNHFHDMADLLVPIYTTSFHLKRQVHFLASDFKPWWPSKFLALLNRLTKHDIIDIDREKQQVLCYDKLIAGLNFYKELVIHPSSPISIQQFRQFLRETYSLERAKAIQRTKKGTTRPRLMIVSRKRTRILTNEDEVSRVAKKLGYEVVVAEMNTNTNMEKFAREVNSCDVMMGIHGAGLTNMVFLPDSAVLIQVVPLGAIEVFARLDFGDPSKGMKIKYLEYKIGVSESSLSRSYPSDHPVLRDPMSFHKKGWGELRSVYLENQNVTIDARRFKGTLAKALKLLRR